MSETPQAPGWWQASDGKWYAPAQESAAQPPPTAKELRARERLHTQQAKLFHEVQPLLEAGERLQAVFVSQTGPSPRGVLSVGLTSNLMRYWTVAVTDRNIVLLPLAQKGKATRLQREPLELLEPPGHRMWFPVRIGGVTHYVAREQAEVVAAANEILCAPQAAPEPVDVGELHPEGSERVAETPEAAWFPDPTGLHQLRYWDGRTWTAHVADQGVPSTDPISIG